MVENLERMRDQLEGQSISVNELGLSDEFVITELHSDIRNNYIIMEDTVNEENHMPKIPIDKVSSIVDDCGEWIVKTDFGVDFIFSIF